MRKTLFLSLILIFILAPIVSCYVDTGQDEISSEEAAAASGVFSSVMYEVDNAAAQAYTPGAAVKTPHDGTINFSSSDGSILVTGTYIYDDAVYSYDYSMTINFNDYTGFDGTVINGSTTMDVSMESQNNFIYSYKGSFTVVYRGVPYILNWDMSLSYLNGSYNNSGYYEVDGNRFDYSYSGGVVAVRN